MSRLAVVRADAGTAIGGGHVMRCLALADAIAERGWRCIFVTDPETLQVVPSLRQSGHEICSTGGAAMDPRSLRAAVPGGCDILIVDHYGWSAEHHAACRPWAKWILAIDDLADRTYDADWLLDSASAEGAADYRELSATNCRFLMGPQYALLRSEFPRGRQDALRRRAATPVATRLLIAPGLIDTDNVAARALEAIAASGISLAADVVLGAAAPHLAALRASVAARGVDVSWHVGTREMAKLMMFADVAVGASGASSWERCCLGLPTVMVATVPNQMRIAEELARRGAAVVLPAASGVEEMAWALRELTGSPARMQAMSQAAAATCDGLGASRVAEILCAGVEEKVA